MFSTPAFNKANPLFQNALRLYDSAWTWAHIARVAGWITGRSNRLLDLTTVEQTHEIRGRWYQGVRPVSLRAIRGSEGRNKDFDAAFRPLRKHMRERWVGIAMLEYQGHGVPAVELIQVGEDYFVRDGHHRVSVARALGREEIDAKVTVWAIAEPIPSNGGLLCPTCQPV